MCTWGGGGLCKIIAGYAGDKSESLMDSQQQEGGLGVKTENVLGVEPSPAKQVSPLALTGPSSQITPLSGKSICANMFVSWPHQTCVCMPKLSPLLLLLLLFYGFVPTTL